MQYPYRVTVQFDEKIDKITTIKYINNFMIHHVTGDYTKYNILKKTDSFRSEFVGIEVAFSQANDAIHFRLGFPADGEKISSKNLSASN